MRRSMTARDGAGSALLGLVLWRFLRPVGGGTAGRFLWRLRLGWAAGAGVRAGGV
ncbi:MAG: hypothetical protein AAB576_08335 [Elusimicrobiota bacterium]